MTHKETLKQGLDSSCKIIGAQLQQHGLEAAMAALEGLQNIIKADAELQIEKPGRPPQSQTTQPKERHGWQA